MSGVEYYGKNKGGKCTCNLNIVGQGRSHWKGFISAKTEEGEEQRPTDIWRKSFPGSEKGQHKGPQVEACLAFLRNLKMAEQSKQVSES